MEKRSHRQAVYLVRSADENVDGSVVEIFWESEVIGKPYYVRSPLTKTWVVRWLTYFGKTQEIRKPSNVRSANEMRVVRLVVICVLFFVFILRVRYIFVVSYGGRKAELERLNSWLLVAFELVICVDIYIY